MTQRTKWLSYADIEELIAKKEKEFTKTQRKLNRLFKEIEHSLCLYVSTSTTMKK